jgi:APA family basic amino acid/polyamine antiporter
LILVETLETTTTAQREDRLPRRLGVVSAVAVLVGSTIGSGIFRVPSTVANDVGTLGAIALIWVLGALVALFGALTLAELAAIFPRSGGIYVFLREAYGPVPAFLFGWTELLVIRPSALGAIAMIFAAYAGNVFGFGEGSERVLAAAAIIVLALTNVRSLVWGAMLNNAATAAKVFALAGIAAVAFMFGDPSTGALSGPVSFEPLSWGGFGVALIAVLWAYDGWADLTFIAGEVKDPERTMPRALLLGTLIVVILYLLVNLAYLYVLPISEMAGSTLVASDAASKIFGAVGASIISGAVMVSAFGALNGSTITGPRILYAMADDGLFFKPIAWVHPRYRTPAAAILLCAGLGVAYVTVQTFEELAGAFIIGIWPFYALAVGAVFIMRRRRPDLHRPYRTFGYPFVPIVFLIASILMLGNSVLEDPGMTLLNFGIILIGIPVYYAWTAWRGRKHG